MSARSCSIPLLMLLSLVALPREAGAQWYFAGYLGGNYTRPAAITVEQPSEQTSLTAERVEFSAKPLESPQYYGVRFGRLFGASSRVGIEVEFIHMKAYARTGETSIVSGTYLGAPVDSSTPQRLDQYFQRFAMSHGLNFLLVNAVSRTPIRSGRTALVLRGGLGPTLPHAETTIGGREREQYEYAGVGAQAAVGIDARLAGRLSAVAEYKLTWARPTLNVVNGVGRTTALTHHVAIGLAFGLPH